MCPNHGIAWLNNNVVGIEGVIYYGHIVGFRNRHEGKCSKNADSRKNNDSFHVWLIPPITMIGMKL
jgi:hypothetical protein